METNKPSTCKRATVRYYFSLARAYIYLTLAITTGIMLVMLNESFPAIAKPVAMHNLTLAQSQSAESFYKQGVAKLQRKDYRGAGSDLNEAIRLKPDYAEAYYGRGRARYYLDDAQGAIVDFNKAISLKPDYAEAYYGRGRARYYLDNEQGAIVDFNKAISLKPNYAEAYYARALANTEIRAYKAASDDFVTALRLKPDYAKSPEIWSDFGKLAYAAGDYKKALEHYNEAFRLQPNYADANYGRAVARFKLNGNLQTLINELETTAHLYREQGNTEGFSNTVAEIKRARNHMNQEEQDDSRMVSCYWGSGPNGTSQINYMSAREARARRLSNCDY